MKKNIKKITTSKRSIRWESPAIIDTIHRAVERLNKNSQPGQRATFNSLVADASHHAAQKILSAKKKKI